jgi:hypothetical protein
MTPLFTTILDLDASLGGKADLLLGGGLGLYLKQEHLRQTGTRTLIPLDRLPQPRTTEDIDLFLRAEVIADAHEVARYRRALDSLGFRVVEGAKWMKFVRPIGATEVVLDLMAGPLGEHTGRVQASDTRIRPRDLEAEVGLHARRTDDAVGVERSPLRLSIHGRRSDNTRTTVEVLVPQAFSYALMKLGALRDRIDDVDKQQGRHHAMDLYRIVGLLTEQEDKITNLIANEHIHSPVVVEARRTIDTLLAPSDGRGRIRLLEYQRMNRDTVPEIDADLLVRELHRLLGRQSE